ncbi:UDP-glucuronosyl/UDP-glucosyltransferase protein [Dioscorea alata]|uniref:UDP-glucuronosyl/UDP-glucosyltransferase protein n=1 Tax=Dioscorea alata TaxID=55571 RepID=A0ACB7WRX7_DIOAL|nr:UDP-glucuronosyl/UDP-glucosyltransferase protein [Dioscorea alata]
MEGKISEPQKQDIAIVLVPLLAQGHLNAFLHLSHHLSSHGLPVHYVSSTSHIHQVISRSTSTTSLSHIHFHHFPLPPYPSPPPTPTSPSTSTHFPSHLQPSFNASLHLKLPLTSLLHSLSSSSRRLILIHDSAMSFAATAAVSIPNVETYVFHTVSAISILLFSSKSTSLSLQDLHLNNLSFSFDGCFTEEFYHFIHKQHQLLSSTSSGRLFNTCRAIEAKDPQKHQCYPLECLQWLNKQPKASVIYVSFGTTSCFSKEQMLELGSGLEKSGERYLWVVRDADRGDIYANNEEDHDQCLVCEQRGMGMVVKGWVPQLEILEHSSMAAFMSHCGWNSCMESLSLGVAMLTWPMHSDQPCNAMLVTDLLKVGIMVRDWNKRHEIVRAVTVRDKVVELMHGDGGKEVRMRARTLGEAIRREAIDGHASRNGGLDSFIAHVTR